jgi:hypothetical protein
MRTTKVLLSGAAIAVLGTLLAGQTIASDDAESVHPAILTENSQAAEAAERAPVNFRTLTSISCSACHVAG